MPEVWIRKLGLVVSLAWRPRMMALMEGSWSAWAKSEHHIHQQRCTRYTLTLLVGSGGMERTTNDVRLARFLLKYIDTIQISVHELDSGVLLGDLGAFVCVADEGGDFVFGVGFVDGEQGIATDVA